MKLFCVLGFLFISALGSLFHFVYDWAKKRKWVGVFVAVNESTWEHMKLAFLPTFLWAIAGLFLGFSNFFFGVFIALLTMFVVIIVLFYSYTFFTKRSILVVDISIFIVSVALAMFFAFKTFGANALGLGFEIVGIIGNILFVIAFFTFTFFPPKNFLFIDPISKNYGFEE